MIFSDKQDVRHNEWRPGVAVQRGTNQAGMRAHNEQLVLSLVRRNGALSKTEIARSTGSDELVTALSIGSTF